MVEKTGVLLIVLVVVFGITACANKGELKEPLFIDSDVSVFEIPGDIRPLSGEIVIRRLPYFEKVKSTSASNFFLIQDKSQYFSNYSETLMDFGFRIPDKSSHEIKATITATIEKSNQKATNSWIGQINIIVAWNPNSGVITKKSIDGGAVPEDKQEMFDDMMDMLKKMVESGRHFDVPISKSNSEFFYKEKVKIGSNSIVFAVKEKIIGETIYRNTEALVAENSGSMRIASSSFDLKGINVISKRDGAVLFSKVFATGTFREEFGDVQLDQSEIMELIDYQPL